MGCPWSNYVNNTDWGYYSSTNGECLTCKERCSNDLKCGGIECNRGYCTWWKKGRCYTDHERTDDNANVLTCLKGEFI